MKKTATGEPVVAKAATYYRMTRYTMVAVLIGMAGWFAYDGFKGWPTENAKIEAARAAAADAAKNAKSTDQPVEKDPMALKQPHSEFDIAIQKLLAFGLPLAAIAMLAWALRNSRGEYRLAGQTLSVPGHPPVEFSDIVEVDKALWDRKGIAYIVYKTSAGTGRLRLDDFIYERDPTDEIYNQIEAYMDSAIQTPAAD